MRPLAAALICAFALACGGGTDTDNGALRQRLAYLEDLAQIEWVEFEGGDVYLGFHQRPSEFKSIVNTATAAGHKAHGRSVTVWAVAGAASGWRPSEGGVLCKASAALGSVREICD